MKRKDTGLDAGAVTLLQLFKGEREYISPLFQREYVWGQKEISSLWEGLDQILEGQDSERFLGALVLEVKSAGMAFKPDSAWIVDGQQRLTTLYMTLVIIAKVAKENDSHELAKMLFEQYIFNQGGTYKNRPKVQPTLVDFKQFNSLFTSLPGEEAKLFPDFGHPTGGLTAAAKIIEKNVRTHCLKDKIFDQQAAIDLVTVILEKLAFVQIILGTEHNAHQVFDSLNSKGVTLENKDLIRNLVFQKLANAPEQAQALYQQKWIPLESTLGDRFDGYFFPFALLEKPTATKSNLLPLLREKWKSLEAFEVIEDLKVHVATYNALSSPDLKLARTLTESEKVNAGLVCLNRMSIPSSIYPFLFRLIRAYQTDNISEEWTVKNIRLIESFLVRRAFAGFEPTGLHAVFKDLWSATKGNPALLISEIDGKVTVQFPNDSAFENDICTRPLYGRKLASYILLEYERSLRGGDPLPENVNFSLDHIIPRELTKEWEDVLAKSETSFEQAHNEIVHTWGNLTPLSIAANSEKGRKNWESCRSFFKTETIYKTTKRLAEDYDNWNANVVKERNKALSIWALGRWSKGAVVTEEKPVLL